MNAFFVRSDLMTDELRSSHPRRRMSRGHSARRSGQMEGRAPSTTMKNGGIPRDLPVVELEKGPPMARILVVEPVAQAGLEILAAAHDTSDPPGRAAVLGLLGEEGGWDALVVRSQTRVDAELLATAAPRLSVVGVASVGTDRVDVAAATRGGVMVVNAPTGNTIAAAEHTMALMLALLRQVPAPTRRCAAGNGSGHASSVPSCGRTLGIIGLGKIGKAVARRAAGFEMRVLTSDPYMTEEQADETPRKLVGLAELLHRSDVISVHIPLTAQTRGLLGGRSSGPRSPERSS